MELESVNAVRSMSLTEVNGLNKGDLKKAFVTLQAACQSNEELHSSSSAASPPVHPDTGLQNMLQQQIAETRMMNANFQWMMVFVNQLQDEMQKIKEDNAQLHQIVTKQQSFLEDIDFQQRGCNLIVTGLNENEPCTINGETAENDADKINLILHIIEMRDVKPVSITRLGKPVESRARPIKVVLDSRETRSNILGKTLTLKNTPALSKVFMKADTHPTYREEWRRLSQVFWTEKNLAENQGHNIVFDKKNRIILWYELRSEALISIPGFVTYQDASGGMAALIRNRLNLFVCKVDVSVINQCWIELQFLPGIAIVGCYFPPPDSPYFALDDLASLQCRIRCAGKKCLLIGDKNGQQILPWVSDLPKKTTMDIRAGPVHYIFRARSPLDNLAIDTSLRLPSDHAPLSLTIDASKVNVYDPVTLLKRGTDLDDDIQQSEVIHVIKKQLKPTSGCGPDGVAPGLFKSLSNEWLGWLTFLLNFIFHDAYPAEFARARMVAIHKDECVKKLKILNDFCKEKDIVINEAKTQFMAINGNGEDKQPLFVDSSHGNLYIEHTNDYVYLGAHFSCDGKISSCISTQLMSFDIPVLFDSPPSLMLEYVYMCINLIENS
ncbi:hypothetical protein CAPTEDRAFT_206211 [Capitella teleta]|uniref:Reverse transcriptase domain-containing protein n=1 Tax=Capitella teleta TaxID=283909 RepID=R7TQG3_CAPTE|nr:hypothetical protein CAPTEDRAFT_206211 [Capitella teleta]|eukprot:ELT96163.1 hypothetical protein CAPTEDRAFT_206211 [Capitella teleta]